jgi:cytochrome c-type biogenesis protein CcmH
MMFWSLVGALIVGVAALVIVPAWRRGPAAADATRDHLRRFAELDEDIAAGDVDPTEAPLLRAELERAVVDAVPDRGAAAPHLGNRVLLAALVIAALLAAIPLYQELGMPRIAELGLEPLDSAASDPHQSIEALLEKVRERTRSTPDDREAWTMLARSTLALGSYAEALSAAERAHRLAPDDVSGMLLYIDALAMHEQGRIGEQARALLDRVLAAEPGNPTGLVLAGIAAQQRGDAARATTLWQQALDALPPGAPFRTELETMLAEVAPDTAAAQTSKVPETGAAVVVTAAVSLAPTLAATAPPDATLFVVARAVDGTPAPLAVARHRTDELPLTVRLDDSMAMVPGNTISTAGSIIVVARVSRSGDAMPAPGDLEGRSRAFDPRQQTAVDVVIDGVRP